MTWTVTGQSIEQYWTRNFCAKCFEKNRNDLCNLSIFQQEQSFLIKVIYKQGADAMLWWDNTLTRRRLNCDKDKCNAFMRITHHFLQYENILNLLNSNHAHTRNHFKYFTKRLRSSISHKDRLSWRFLILKGT